MEFVIWCSYLHYQNISKFAEHDMWTRWLGILYFIFAPLHINWPSHVIWFEKGNMIYYDKFEIAIAVPTFTIIPLRWYPPVTAKMIHHANHPSQSFQYVQQFSTDVVVDTWRYARALGSRMQKIWAASWIGQLSETFIFGKKCLDDKCTIFERKAIELSYFELVVLW